jgi:catalase
MIKLPIREIQCDITLNAFLRDNNGKEMSSNEGVKISDDSNSLKAGDRGPSSF